MLGVAFAMAGQPAAGGGQGNMLTSLLPLVIIFGIFYFLLIRPQQKQQKKQRQMLSEIKRDDRIVTKGGVHGIVRGVTEKVLQIEITDNVKIKINRDAVSYIDTPSDDLDKKDK